MAKTDDRDSQLRSAVFVGDGQHLVAVLLQEPWGDRLQLAGDGLLIALAQGVDRASELASQCASELRARAWEGDEDLAEQLDAVLGKGPAPMVRPFPVDLEELAGILEGDPVYGGGRIDLRTGEVWPQAAIDYVRETGEDDPDDEDPDRWLAGCGARAPAMTIGTWRTSSRRSGMRIGPISCPLPSRVEGRSVASRTSWPAGPASSNAGTPFLTNANEAVPEHGSPQPATHLAVSNVTCQPEICRIVTQTSGGDGT
ncbi:MAG TPA: hypothetical protein VHB02_02155 [Acidimicrobiales bacterium]|nr:hypothetical protein [Acidimicrobiales bacterium]